MRVLLAALLVLGAAHGAEAQAPTSPAPAPPPQVVGRVLTVEDAISIALQTQPQIRQRLFLYAAARFRVDQALSPLLPQLTGLVTTTKSQTVSTQTAGVSTSSLSGTGSVTVTSQRDFNETFLGQVSLSQLLFDFGKNYASVNAQRKNAELTFEDVELQRQLISQTVKQSYTDVNFSQRLIRVQQQAVERADLNLRSAKGFFEVGTRPKSDVTRAEVDVANAQVALIQARNAEQLARVALTTAMGLSADTPLQLVDNLAFQPVTLDRPVLQAEALKNRPEYRQAKLSVDAAEAALRRTTLDFLPDVTGTATYGGSQTGLLPTWSAGFNFTWTLFDGGNRIARHREAKANVDAARENVRTTELTVGRDVETAILTVEEARERIQAAQKLVESAQENFRLAQGRFDAGVGTILELTDAQLALTQAQNTEAQALSDYQKDLASLDRAIGRR
jgi:outer membrane protein